MIVGLLKSEMGFTYDQLLYKISFQNLILLSSAVPSYDFESKKKGRSVGKNSNDTKVTTNKTGLAAIIDTTRKAMAGQN
jgi:hypothetical protein